MKLTLVSLILSVFLSLVIISQALPMDYNKRENSIFYLRGEIDGADPSDPRNNVKGADPSDPRNNVKGADPSDPRNNVKGADPSDPRNKNIKSSGQNSK
ncbi:hypothetical protein RclHR1_26190002 [Rhizophagus clarus]|uniref:Uncharacterized protein n=1 Tax=Rhizophagus clarus TaxID=94130 RepID=A0A2Z6RUZ9_9GLOM|nr:hypothetical protein RclHR1_26190002 [Rhizophagus clarus]